MTIQQQYAPPATGAPPRRSLVPWLVAALVLLVAAVGVIAFLLLEADDDGRATTGDERVQAEEQLGDVDGDAVVPPEADEEQVPDDHGAPYTGDGGTVPGSVDRAAAFMDDVVLGDFPSAVGHGGSDFQDRYGPDETLLADDIAAITTALPVDYTIDAVQSDSGHDADVVTLTVELPDGSYSGLGVYVADEDGIAVVIGFQ
ncbi:hypothetical protein [Blastococcus sp. TF02A-26]|uniref:hypothetical protein n=1 Tax=Blastococcus sp. TF02A-26 TaxID=2250577 RepID=UPI0013148CE1|nr:hypothetical protein [Blastococcus sp. TF02A-26]